MFARFDENPSMTFQDIKKTKRYGRTDGRTDAICLAYMNMFARFDENPSMTFQDIKKTKRYGRTDGRTDRQTDNVKTVYPPQTKFAGGITTIQQHKQALY